MNRQAQAIQSIPAAAPARFDLRATGLSDAQLKSIAGARMAEKTNNPTNSPTTTCCWGV